MRRILLALLVVAVGLLALTLLATAFVESFLWLSGKLGLHHQLGTDTQTSQNYASVSGVLPIVVATLGFSGILVGAWRHLECHEATCHKRGLVRLPDGTRCCHEHDPRHPNDKPLPGHVGRMWEAHKARTGI
jgi:hypothetical protein